ncbi:MAG: polymerase sigma-70 factor, subfamily [Actinomycetota bacterium]|nr:polymerase sigma-70 factor, subfamily [Actinomycetota bacterium]
MAEVDGAAAALELVDALDLGHYHFFHAIRADLLSRLGRDADAAQAYDAAIAAVTNSAERTFLERARRELYSPGSPGALLRRGPLRTRRAAFTAPGSSRPPWGHGLQECCWA